jgi:sugar (pentulose or hexulose) kinase
VETGLLVQGGKRMYLAGIYIGTTSIQYPERIINIVNELIQACKAEWQEVEVIGISCQMHAFGAAIHAGMASGHFADYKLAQRKYWIEEGSL